MSQAFWSEARAGALFFLVLTCAALVAAAFFAFESWALSKGKEPITVKVRNFVHGYPWIAALLIFSLGYLAGHLFNGA